jgi:hypothetical protein
MVSLFGMVVASALILDSALCLLLPTKRDDKSKSHPEHHASFEQVFTA